VAQQQPSFTCAIFYYGIHIHKSIPNLHSEENIANGLTKNHTMTCIVASRKI